MELREPQALAHKARRHFAHWEARVQVHTAKAETLGYAFAVSLYFLPLHGFRAFHQLKVAWGMQQDARGLKEH